MYNRYFGNTGRVQRMPEPQNPGDRPQKSDPSPRPAVQRGAPPQQTQRPTARPGYRSGPPPLFMSGGMQKQPAQASGRGKPGGLLGSLAAKLDLSKLETDDIILLLILYLLYRESGDEELLIMMGAMFLL